MAKSLEIGFGRLTIEHFVRTTTVIGAVFGRVEYESGPAAVASPGVYPRSPVPSADSRRSISNVLKALRELCRLLWSKL